MKDAENILLLVVGMFLVAALAASWPLNGILAALCFAALKLTEEL